MAKEPNIIRAKVVQPTYINGVLHLPGETAVADLDALGIDKLGHGEITLDYVDSNGDPKSRKFKANLTPGLVEISDNEAEAMAQVPVVAVAPHAPLAPNPQGIPPGTVQSGTGRLIAPTGPDETAHELVGADKPLPQDNNDKPTKSSK